MTLGVLVDLTNPRLVEGVWLMVRKVTILWSTACLHDDVRDAVKVVHGSRQLVGESKGT